MHTATIITDLTFGDAGKGSITDALARRGARLVVRSNGGAQAAHTVLDERGRCHTFHQFGSGTFVDGVETFLSRHMLVNPLALHYEETELREQGVDDAFERMHVDARALVTTPYHTILNRLRELARGAGRHGSCGLGIGETACDALECPAEVPRFGDLKNGVTLRRKLAWHREWKQRQADALLPQLFELPANEKAHVGPLLDQLHSDDELEASAEVFEFVASRVRVARPDFLALRLSQPGDTIFEGAQGVLLDEDWGFHPFTTWSTTTPANALELIQESGAQVETRVLGLTRAYATRHGAGPFPTESEALTQALPDPHNPTNPWQGPFRAGWLDLSLLRYAIQVSGRVDGLVFTCLDRLAEMPEVRLGVGYTRQGQAWEPTTEAPGSLEHRERDGQILREVGVTTTPAPTEPMVYASHVAEQLQLPLLGASCGPRAGDKSFEF